jgi:TonB family protein
MNPRRVFPRVAAGLFLGLVLGMPLAAQQRLSVLEPDGKYHPVLKVSQDRPIILDQEKLVAATGTRYALQKVDEYMPLYIEVRAKDIGTSALEPLSAGPAMPTRLNHEFHFSAEFKSAVRLDDVFLVLALETEGQGRNIFPYEIGVLEAWTPRQVSVFVPLEQGLGAGRCSLLLFVGGAEVFTSEQPDVLREAMLDRMVARRIAGVKQAGPRLLFGPAPEYPAALRQAGRKGSVVAAMRVSPQGGVSAPVIEEASDPALGAAVLAVLPRWRFVPRVEKGRAVETRIKLPLAFDPADGVQKP